MKPRPVPNAVLNERLETVAWGLFRIMLGGLRLIPRDRVPSGIWLLGVGTILLVLAGAKIIFDVLNRERTAA